MTPGYESGPVKISATHEGGIVVHLVSAFSSSAETCIFGASDSDPLASSVVLDHSMYSPTAFELRIYLFLTAFPLYAFDRTSDVLKSSHLIQNMDSFSRPTPCS